MEIISRINWVDVLVIIVILRISYVAFHAGFSHEVFPVIGGVLIMVLGLHYYSRIGNSILQGVLNIPVDLANFISFLLLAVIIGAAFKLVEILINKLVKVEWNPFIERLGGVILGLTRAAISASLILLILALAPLAYLQHSIRDRSLTGMYFLRIGPIVYDKIAEYLPDMGLDSPMMTKEDLLRDISRDKTVAPSHKKEKKAVSESEE